MNLGVPWSLNLYTIYMHTSVYMHIYSLYTCVHVSCLCIVCLVYLVCTICCLGCLSLHTVVPYGDLCITRPHKMYSLRVFGSNFHTHIVIGRAWPMMKHVCDFSVKNLGQKAFTKGMRWKRTVHFIMEQAAGCACAVSRPHLLRTHFNDFPWLWVALISTGALLSRLLRRILFSLFILFHNPRTSP